MKRTILSRSLLIIMMIAAMGMTINVSAQGPGHGRSQAQKASKASAEMRMKVMLPDLTDDQVAKIKALRLEMLKQLNPIKAKMREKQAHLQSLSIAEKPDMAAINKTIDEIGALKIQMMKIHAKFRQDMRTLLTEDQRVIFDSKAGMRMGKGMKGHGYHGSRGPGGCRG